MNIIIWEILASISSKPSLSDYRGRGIYFFGDSITAGGGASSSANRWTTKVARMLGSVQNNFGASSSTLEKRNPINPLSAINMVDRISTIPPKSNSTVLLIFAFGMNDWGYNGADYTPAHFKEDYQTILDNAFLKGWLPAEILIVSPSYPNDAAFNFYNRINGTNVAPERQRMLDFVQASQEVAALNELMFIDMYEEFLNNAPTIDLTIPDGVHPNDAGHAIWANRVYNELIAAA